MSRQIYNTHKNTLHTNTQNDTAIAGFKHVTHVPWNKDPNISTGPQNLSQIYATLLFLL